MYEQEMRESEKEQESEHEQSKVSDNRYGMEMH